MKPSISVVTNSSEPAIFVRYNRVKLCTKMTNLPLNSVRFNQVFVINRARYSRVSLYISLILKTFCFFKTFKSKSSSFVVSATNAFHRSRSRRSASGSCETNETWDSRRANPEDISSFEIGLVVVDLSDFEIKFFESSLEIISRELDLSWQMRIRVVKVTARLILSSRSRTDHLEFTLFALERFFFTREHFHNKDLDMAWWWWWW
jgi:hypothetical protein